MAPPHPDHAEDLKHGAEGGNQGAAQASRSGNFNRNIIDGQETRLPQEM